MELIGLKVKHTAFGIGVITDMEGNYITVEFASKTSKFVYPDAFEKFLEAEHVAVQQMILDSINDAKAAAEQKRQAEEAARKAADDAYNALSDYEKSLVGEAAKKALDDAKAALAELNKPADPNSPATGDNSNMALWIALLFISGGAVITLNVVDRKRRTASKR